MHKSGVKHVYKSHLSLLKTAQKHDSIIILVDHFSKMAHFLPCSKTYNASRIATIYFNKVVSTVLNLDWYTGISIEILVFYPKRYDKCKILPENILDRY